MPQRENFSDVEIIPRGTYTLKFIGNSLYSLESRRHIFALVLRNAYIQSYSHLKWEILVLCCEQKIYVNSTWFFSHFVKNVKFMNDNFFHFLWYWLEKHFDFQPFSAWFHMKSLKLHDLGKNGNSYQWNMNPWNAENCFHAFFVNVNLLHLST